jgi:arsenate reductase (thioredoxin)
LTRSHASSSARSPTGRSGDACPLLPGKHYEDWELEDPSGKTIEEIRPTRDQIRDRVTDLLQRLTAQ